jgi:hypothetical protein
MRTPNLKLSSSNPHVSGVVKMLDSANLTLRG